jgi:energy-coupling factor transporter ATP-binding protein EcfA2
MQTSIPHPQVLFIDGLPGSGKSTAAKAVGGALPRSRVFAETDLNHPLLVAAPDQIGAAFAGIHEVHSAGSFAAAALERLESFLASAGNDVLYVFESHPIQSTVRVLFQLDAPQATILQFWSDLQDRLASVQPRLIYFHESDPL